MSHGSPIAHRPKAPNWPLTGLVAALLAASVASTPARAQTAPISDASVADFERQLAAADGPVTKGFRMTAAPDERNRCAGNAKDSEGPGTKTLEVVGYGEDDAPQSHLALRFDNNSDELGAADRRLLGKLAQAMNGPALRDGRFAIAGHTNTKGDDTRAGAESNLRLSCARAIRVVAYLVNEGRVSRDRLTAYGFGSRKLLSGFDPAAAQHRRVEVRRGD